MELSRSFRVIAVLPDGQRTFECAENEFVWNGAARAGLLLPAICHQGRCLTCAAKLVKGELDQTASVSYFPEDRQAGFVLLCSGRPREDLTLITHQEHKMRQHRIAHRLPAPYA
jgi:ferredoxin